MDSNRLSRRLQCTVQREIKKEECKRPRTDDNSGGELLDMAEKERNLCGPGDDSEVEEFFSLLDKIQSMRKLLKHKQMNLSSTTKNVGCKDVKLISQWKPSFIWEDFSVASPSAQIHLTHNNEGCSGRSLTPYVESDKHLKSFDLNVEATHENCV